jgi:hypothetical protein
MTSQQRDFDRIARAWLELGPNEAPERPIAAVLQAIETTPQVRRPLRWPTWRSATMSRITILAVLAGTIAIIVGGLVLSGGDRNESSTPPPAPTTDQGIVPSAVASPVSTATSSATQGPLPDTLAGGWVAPLRGVVGGAPGLRMDMTLGATAGRLFAPSGTTAQPFTAALLEPGLVRLTSTQDVGVCSAGDAGTYAVGTLPGGWLSMTTVDEDCAARADIVDGMWQRSIAHGGRGGPGIAAPFDPVIQFTLPEDTYSGRGNSELETIVIDRADASYKVWKDPDGFKDPCDLTAGRSLLEPGMDAFVEYLTTDPRFTVTGQQEYEIDGHPAIEVAFTIGEDLEAPCHDFDGDQTNKIGVLTWVPRAARGSTFWNDQLGGKDILVVTEVDGVTLAFEFVVLDGDVWRVDRETLDTVRFLDGLPEPPSS